MKIDTFPPSSAFEANDSCPHSRQESAIKFVMYPMPNAFKATLKYFISTPNDSIFSIMYWIGVKTFFTTIPKTKTPAKIEIKSAYSHFYCFKVIQNTALTRQMLKILIISIFKDQIKF